MKKIFTGILIPLLLITNSYAQTAPVKGKGQAQSTYQTIERLETPNSGVTVTADKAVLLEGDPENLLVNPGFEHQTFGTGWTVNAGTATVDTTNFYDGKKSMSISLSAVNGDILTQCVTPTGQKGGTNMSHSLRVKTTLSNLQVCSVIGSTEQQCVSASNIDSWVEILATSVATNGSALCVKLKSTSSATGTVKVDSGYIGRNRNIGSAANAKNVVSFVWSGSQTATHDTDVLFTWSGATINKLENMTHSSGVFTITVPGDYQVKFCPRMDSTPASASLMRQQTAKVYKNSTSTPLDASGYIPGLAQNNINGGGEPSTGFYATPPPCVVNTSAYSIGDTLRFKAYQANGSGTNFAWIGGVLEINYFPSSQQQVVSPNCVGTSDCENIFTAIVSNADVVSNENVDWLNGNCTDAATGRATCIFNTSIFSSPPNCLAVANDSSNLNQITCSLTLSPTTSQVGIDCKSNATDSNQNFTLICQRTGSDRKPLNNVPILIGSVTSASTGAIRHEFARVNNNGTATISFQGQSDWLTGCTRTVAGSVTCTIKTGYFSASPACYVTLLGLSGNIWVNPVSTTSATILVRNQSNTDTDNDFYISCSGLR